MRQQKQFTVVSGDKTITYTLLQCGATRGRRAFTRLIKVVGKPLTDFLRNGITMGNGSEIADSDKFLAMLAAAEKVIDNLSEEDMDYFCDLMAEHTMVDGQMLSAVFEEHFVGKYDVMVKWLVAALQHNFASFFTGMGVTGLPAGLPEKKAP